MRGAITLAAVLTLPVALASGSLFPARDLAILLAAGVIVLSLLLATLALPRALRGLVLEPEVSNQAAEDRVRRAAAEVAVLAIEAARLQLIEGEPTGERYANAEARILNAYRLRIAHHRSAGSAATHGQDNALESRLRLVGLRAEREETLRLGQEQGLGEIRLRKLVRELDLQETRHGEGQPT